MTDRKRGISTVVDVSLALVLISASVVMMAVFLQGGESTHDPLTADRTAETVAGMTLGVHYDIEDVKDHRPYGIDWPSSDDAYERSWHAPAATLLAEAAVANATYDGTHTTVTGQEFEEAIDGRFRSRIAGAETNAHLRAVWRPYEGASIRGVATAGVRPPADEDVSSVTLSVPSGVDPDERVRRLHRMGDEERTEELGEAIVEYTFPEEASVHGIESEGIRRAMTVYRYCGFLWAVESPDECDFDGDDDPLGRMGADTDYLEDEIVEDATSSLQEMMEDEQESFGSDEQFEEWLRIGEVEIVVRTWNP